MSPIPSAANRPHQCHLGDDTPHQRAPGHTAGLGNDHCQHRHQLQRQFRDPAADICVAIPVLSRGRSLRHRLSTAPRARRRGATRGRTRGRPPPAFPAERPPESASRAWPRRWEDTLPTIPQFLQRSYPKVLSWAPWPGVHGDFPRPSVYLFQRNRLGSLGSGSMCKDWEQSAPRSSVPSLPRTLLTAALQRPEGSWGRCV